MSNESDITITSTEPVEVIDENALKQAVGGFAHPALNVIQAVDLRAATLDLVAGKTTIPTANIKAFG